MVPDSVEVPSQDEEVIAKEVETVPKAMEAVFGTPDAIDLGDSPEIDLKESQQSTAVQELAIKVGDEAESASQKSEKPNRPLTRQRARQSGEDVWPWMSGYPATGMSSDEDEFVTEEVEIAPEGPAGKLDGLLPPRSMNYLEPTRELVKMARKSDLELLKQSRLNRQQRHAETPDLSAAPRANLQLPIFDHGEAAAEVSSPYAHSRVLPQTHRPKKSQPTRPQEALEPRKKRPREFEANPSDYLPSFGPDFIVDDGSGYSVDPRYSKPQEPRTVASAAPAKKSSKSDWPLSGGPRTPSTHSTSPIDRIRIDSSGYRYESQDHQTENIAYQITPVRSTTPTNLASSAMILSSDTETSSRISDPWVATGPEHSNAASIATSSALGSVSNTTHAMVVDQAIVPKLRLTMRVKDESFFISCPPDSTFAWLQQEASNKYKQVTRLEVAFDHLETVYGSRLMPNDMIREYMNDLETVVGIIRESKPVSLVTLYKTDCQALLMAENEEIVSRLSQLESLVPGMMLPTSYSTSTIHLAHSGVHRVLPMQGLGLTQRSIPTLFGLLNLHSFACIDFSSNALSSGAFCEVITELCKSKELENLEILSFRDNLLGLALDIEPIRPLFSKLVGITTLDLSENTLNDRAIGTLVPLVLGNFPSLTSLDLSSNFFGLPAIQTMIKANLNLSRLKTLRMARNPLNQEAFSILISGFPDICLLEHLDLSYTDIFASNGSEMDMSAHSLLIPPLEETIELIGSKFAKLQFLGLRGCHIDTHASPMLLPMLLLTLKRCSTIDLADCGLTASDMKMLRTLLQSPNLISIDLSFNNLHSLPTIKSVSHLLHSIQGRQSPVEIKLQNCQLDHSEFQNIQSSMADGLLPNTLVHLSCN